MNMSRRSFVGVAMAAGASQLVPQAYAATAAPIRAVAFDGFVIFDPRPVVGFADRLVPGRGAELVEAWRTRQFEYTWLRTLSGRYVDFWRVTEDALRFAAASRRIALTPEQEQALMQAHLQLPAWPDVRAGLESLRSAGLRLALLSNFSEAMLEANLRSAGLGEFFEARLSTDRVGAYKPDARAYQMGVASFGLPKEQIAFAAFGGWDAAGAKAFGYPTFWANRANAPAEELGISADAVGTTLADLARFVSRPSAGR